MRLTLPVLARVSGESVRADSHTDISGMMREHSIDNLGRRAQWHYRRWLLLGGNAGEKIIAKLSSPDFSYPKYKIAVRTP